MNPRLPTTLASIALLTATGIHAADERSAAAASPGVQSAIASAGVSIAAVPPRQVALSLLDSPAPPAGMVHNGRDLHFNADMGVFAVSGHRDVYFWQGHYYQMHNQRWVRAASLDRPLWRFVPEDVVPSGLLDQG